MSFVLGPSPPHAARGVSSTLDVLHGSTFCVCVWYCSNWSRVYIPRQSYTFLYLDDPSIHPSILIHRPTDLYIFTYLIPRLSFFPCITTEPTCSHNLSNRTCLHTFLYLHMHLYQHTSLDLPTHTHLLTGLHAYHA